MIEMVEQWGEALERMDPGTWSHCRRVAALAKVLAKEMKLGDEEIGVIALGALLHEVGKLGIPEAILRKPAVLTAEERLVMRESPSRGYEMLRSVRSFAEVAEIVYAHRERFDGNGYPRGLKGEAIPLGARVVAVADAFETLVSDRPHEWMHALAAPRMENLRWSGRQLDPQVVEVLLKVPDEDWQRARS